MKKYWKEVLLGSIIALIIIPLIIAYMMSFSLIITDTNNAWIGFWGSYLGAIIGGVISGCVAMYVLVKTLKDNKMARQREEVINFCNMLVSKSRYFAQKLEAAIYEKIDYSCYREKDPKSAETIESCKHFLLEYNSSKITLHEILEHLEIRKNIQAFQTVHMISLIKFSEELYDIVIKFGNISEQTDMTEWKSLEGKLHEFLEILGTYEIELLGETDK